MAFAISLLLVAVSPPSPLHELLLVVVAFFLVFLMCFINLFDQSIANDFCFAFYQRLFLACHIADMSALIQRNSKNKTFAIMHASAQHNSSLDGHMWPVSV